jgi:pyroglutamyl-peptidase
MKKKGLTQKELLILSFFLLLFIISPSYQSIFEQDNENIILVTGFKPFDVYEINPSELVALQLNNTLIQNYTIKGYVLPVDYRTAPQKIKQLISLYHPKLIISLGLAGKAESIHIEKIAVNLRIDPDERFPLLTLRKVNTSGPWIQSSTFDSSAIKNQILNEGIPVEYSFSAGLYVCNAILYETLFYQKETDQSIPTGFLHVPQLDNQHPDGMSLDMMIQAVNAAILSQIN